MVKIRCSALVLYGVGRKNLSENTIPQVLASAVPFNPFSRYSVMANEGANSAPSLA